MGAADRGLSNTEKEEKILILRPSSFFLLRNKDYQVDSSLWARKYIDSKPNNRLGHE